MKTSLSTLLKSIAFTVLGGLASMNIASAQQIRVDLDAAQVERLIGLIGGEVDGPDFDSDDFDSDDFDSDDYDADDFEPDYVQPDFNRPVIVQPDVQPDVQPVPAVVDVIPQRLQDTWVETTATGTTYHQLKADGTHNLGILRNGQKERYTQKASYSAGTLRLQGGTYSIALSQNKTLRLTNNEGVRTWVRFEKNQPAVNNLQTQLLGVWYEETSEGSTPMLYRYEFNADGTYDMQSFDRGRNGRWDMANPVGDLGSSVPVSQRKYTVNGSTLELAKGWPHAEGPLGVQAAANQMSVTEGSKVRVWKRTP